MPNLSIGRNPNNDIVLQDSFVSASHATLWTDEAGRCFLEDKNSTNGSFINGKRIEPNKPYLLQIKDEVIIGKQLLDWKAHLLNPKTDNNATQIAIQAYQPPPVLKKQTLNEKWLWTIIWALLGLSILLLVIAYIG